MYDLEHAYKMAERSKNGDEKRLENGKKLSDVCVKGKGWIILQPVPQSKYKDQIYLSSILVLEFLIFNQL